LSLEVIVRGFIPGFGIAYLTLEILGVEMRFIDSFASGVDQRLVGHGCFWVTHDL
jgi:hypothetical protein